MNEKELGETIRKINSVLVRVEKDIAFRELGWEFNKLITFILQWEQRIVQREEILKQMMKLFSGFDGRIRRLEGWKKGIVAWGTDYKQNKETS